MALELAKAEYRRRQVDRESRAGRGLSSKETSSPESEREACEVATQTEDGGGAR